MFTPNFRIYLMSPQSETMPYITKSRTSLQWHKGDKPNEGTWQQMVRLDQTGGAVAEYALRSK